MVLVIDGCGRSFLVVVGKMAGVANASAHVGPVEGLVHVRPQLVQVRIVL